MYDNTYAIVSEANGVIYVIDLDDPDNSPNITDFQHIVSTGISQVSGDGVEGVAYEIGSSSAANPNTAIFYAVREVSPVIRKVGWNGQQIGNELTIPNVNEGSDVYYAEENDSLYVVSHTDRRVAQYEANSSFTSISQQSSMVLQSGFVQPEGITFTSDLSRMFIASETRNNGANALSFGIFIPQ